MNDSHNSSKWTGVGIFSLLCILGLLGVLYAEILVGMVFDWENDPNYSHGFIVPFISVYLIWERWSVLKSLPMQPNPWGALLLMMGLAILVIGSVGAELYTQRVSLIVVLSGLVLLILGKQLLVHLSLPLAFLIFMVPLPAIVVNTIAFPLQLLAAQTAAFCLFQLGIPVFREGNLISLAGTTLEVAEACSGLRSLLSLITLGTVFAYFSQQLNWKRWILVGLSIPIAIVANAFRVTGTGVMANQWGPEAAQGFYHTFEGWLVFVVAFVMLLGCGMFLSRIGGGNQKSDAPA
jgi:exosortase